MISRSSFLPVATGVGTKVAVGCGVGGCLVSCFAGSAVGGGGDVGGTGGSKLNTRSPLSSNHSAIMVRPSWMTLSSYTSVSSSNSATLSTPNQAARSFLNTSTQWRLTAGPSSAATTSPRPDTLSTPTLRSQPRPGSSVPRATPRLFAGTLGPGTGTLSPAPLPLSPA